jgi:hypothetical protein
MKGYTANQFANPVHGQLLRLSAQHEIAIYLRDGASWVAEFTDGRGELMDAATWFRFHIGTLRYSHGLRAAALKSATALTQEVLEKIERLHRQAEARDSKVLTGGLAVLESVKRYCSDMASRMHGLTSKRVH